MLDLSELAVGLHQDSDGIWQGASDQLEVSYPAGAHHGCRALEADSFWFSHRTAVLLEAIQRFPAPGVIVDLGGGNGVVTQALLEAGHAAILVEPGLDGVCHARQRGIQTIIRATLAGAQFRPGALPAAGLFDVLEHIEDEHGFLQLLRSRLAPHGRLYVTVPALPWLWSEADDSAGHYRRYTLSQLTATLQACGLAVEYTTYLFSFLVVPILFGRTWWGRLRAHRPRPSMQQRALREHRPQLPAVRAALAWLRRYECAKVRAGGSLPVGSSCLVVATPQI